MGPNQLKTTLEKAPGVLATWNRTGCAVLELIFLGSTIHLEKDDYNICDRPLTVHIWWDPINLRRRWKSSGDTRNWKSDGMRRVRTHPFWEYPRRKDDCNM